MINTVDIAVFIKSWVHSLTFHLDCLEVRAYSFKASKFAVNSSMSMSMGSVSSFVFDPTSTVLLIFVTQYVVLLKPVQYVSTLQM